ncbi:MAG TPA: methyltransferase domain-containing protein [Desulfobulbus sp.]|nr:methyltransferase domain-containing protein [Desulfobulbus sp.]
MDNSGQADITRHEEEILQNLGSWQRKPLLRQIYADFYRRIAGWLVPGPGGRSVELGSGIGNIREVLPGCLRTDLFPNPWIDRVESAYGLSFAARSIDNLILFDVFHHLRYPGTALAELHRVLVPGGRVLIFEPCLSLLGLLVFGPLHREPLGLGEEIRFFAPADWSPEKDSYYASQGNAARIFLGRKYRPLLRKQWTVLARERFAAISYIASGGYSGPQLYPDRAFPLMQRLDAFCDRFPRIFATRLLVVLEKKSPH